MDEAAFQSFYRRTAPALLGYIRWMCGNADLAEDLLQETFYRFLRKEVGKLNEPQMKTYLYKTASSLVVDHRRRLKRRQRWSWQSLLQQQAEQNSDLTEDMTRLLAELKGRIEPYFGSPMWKASRIARSPAHSD